MCTFCYTPYIGCPKGRRHYYLQWLKCKTAIKNGHSYCPIGESTEVRELQKLSGNVLACPFHTHIAIQQIEFEFRQRDEVPSPIDSSEPSSPTTSNTTYVASDDESEIEFNQAGQKSLHRPSSTAVYLDLRFPKPGPIKRDKSATPTKTQTTNIQQSTDRSLNSQSEPNTASICGKSVPGTSSSSSSSSSSKKGPVISPGLPASPAAYRQSRSQPQTQPHAKLTLKALTEVDESNKELRSANKLSEPAYYPPSPPPPEIITTLPTPVDQANPSNPDLLTRRLGPSTALTITITKAPKLNIQKITSSKSEPDLKSTPKGLKSSNSTTTSTSHTFDSFLTPSGTLQPKSCTTNSSTTTINTTTTSSSSNLRSRSGSLFTRLKDGTTTTLHHSALSRTLSASTTNTNRRRQASATHPKNVAPWDQVLLPASISKPVNLEVGVNASTRKPTNLAVDGTTNCALSSELKAIDGHLQGRLGGQGPRTAPLPAEMEVMMSRLESVGVGVGLGIGLAVTRDTDEGKSVSGHKRSCSANMLQGRMGIGLSGLRKRGECS